MATPIPSHVPAPTSPLVRTGVAAVRALSLVRGERVIHARGRALTGRLVVGGGVPTGTALLDVPTTYDVVVRLSRALGTPAGWPDVLGFAVRVLDAGGPGRHQDLLLDSAIDGAPLLRRAPGPVLDVMGATYCSLLPYVVGGRRMLIGARGVPGSPRVTDLGALPLPSSFGLLVASARGPWAQVGVVTVDRDLPAPQGRRLRFSPATTGGALVPAGPMQDWRRASYPASHVGPDA